MGIWSPFKTKGKYTGICAGRAMGKCGKKKVQMIRLEDIREFGGLNVSRKWNFMYDERFERAGPFVKGDVVYFEHRFEHDFDSLYTALIGRPSKIRKIVLREDIALARPPQYDIKWDFVRIRDYAKKHYDGDMSRMTGEEMERFVIERKPVEECWPATGRI